MERSVAWGGIIGTGATVLVAPLLGLLTVPPEVVQWLVMEKWGVSVPLDVAKYIAAVFAGTLTGLGALFVTVTTHLVRNRYRAGEPGLAMTAAERAKESPLAGKP